MRRPDNHTLTKTSFLLFFLLILLNSAFSQNPVANFTANRTSGCSPLTVAFTDQSTGNPTSWNWDFGNGQLSTVQNPTVSYSQPGVYTVRLIVRNNNGIDDEIKTNYITVDPSPSAGFIADMTTACVPATINFTDQSTVPAGSSIISWEWDFGDGGTSTLQNPSHTFTATGFYTISLRVTSTSGCQNFTSIGRYIRVISGISTDFVFTQPGTCQAPFTIQFTDQSNGPGTLSYVWNFGNGGPTSTLQNPTAVYNAPGTYTVQLDVQSTLGCSGSISRDIVISGKTTDFTAPLSVCIGQTVNFQNNSSPAPVSSLWTFGDATTSSQINPIKTYFTAGTYQVKLINDYGSCSDSVTKTINVISQPTVDFTSNDSTSCQIPFTVQFNDSSPAASTWLWDFGDGSPNSTQQNPSHTYTNAGFYNVTLTITLPGGCSNTITKTQYIKIQNTTVNIANVPDGGCVPFTFSPLPLIGGVDSVASYLWDMGEAGGIYTTQFPTHTYSTVGNYDITLTVTMQSGCVVSVTIPNAVRVGTKPTANFSFTPNNVCASTPVQFTDLSITTPGAFIQWDWDFGDTTASTAQNPQHVYEDTGTLRIRLIVSNNGCKDTAFQSITVFPPVAKFGYTVDCNNRTLVTFLDSSLVDPAYGPITYEWHMGDPANTVITGSSPPTFNYPAIGTYTATLIVTNGPCTYQKSIDIILADEPVTFTVDRNPVCKGMPFTLTATGSLPANIKDYTWTIGTTTFNDTTRTISHSINTYGTYDVTLIIEDINGCLNSTTIPNYITVSGPVADFQPTGPGGCINSTISFTDQSVIAGSPITQWTWNYGDGNQQVYNTPPFNHVYTNTGSYTVGLTIRDNAGCTDTYSLPNAVVITDPKAAFRADTVYCPQSPLQFIDTSSGSGLTHYWEFGDGGSSTLQNPTHLYALGDNIYNVKLVITDMGGCKDSITKNQYVKIRSPKPAFSMIDSSGFCLPLNTSFTMLGTDYQSVLWDFGDGATSTALNPSHFYATYGTYFPKLYLIGPGGCIDSAQATVKVYNPATDMNISASPQSSCNSITTTFTLTTVPDFRFKFFFGDGTVDSSQQTTIVHTYNSPGNYTPFITVADRFGCEVAHYGSPVNVYGAIPLFGMDKKEFCGASDVEFKNFTLNNDPITSILWNFGDGGTSSVQDPVHMYTNPGTYLPTLTVTTQNNCTSSFTDTVRVYPDPQLSIIARDTICINTPEIFNGLLAQQDSTAVLQWTFGNGTTSSLYNPSVTYNSTGNFTITLIASNKLDCADTTTHTVYVSPLPTATAVTTPLQIISGASATLNMNYTGSPVYYNWLPNTNLDCTNCPSPVANPQFSTRYVVQIADRNGCRNTGEILVNVVCNGQNFFIPNTFSPNGDGSNEIFYPRGTGVFRIKTLMVFNRWGEIVFEKRDFPVNNAASGWDGNYKGKKASADVYVYQMEIQCSNGTIIKYAGNIALIR